MFFKGTYYTLDRETCLFPRTQRCLFLKQQASLLACFLCTKNNWCGYRSKGNTESFPHPLARKGWFQQLHALSSSQTSSVPLQRQQDSKMSRSAAGVAM